MFHWHKDMKRLDIPAKLVLHLEQSLSPAQVALPGLPSQEATAYLCAFSQDAVLRIALVLYLRTSRKLAFYLHDRVEAAREKREGLIEEGRRFAESMGFTLGNLDYQQLGDDEQVRLWASLPLKAGVDQPSEVNRKESMDIAQLAQGPESASSLPQEADEVPSSLELPAPILEEIVELEEKMPPKLSAPPVAPETPSDLPPESRRSIAPAVHKRTRPARGLAETRQRFLESLGRFLASM